MDLRWSIDDVVRTSDENAVRSRFAKRNRVWLTFLLVFFSFASLISAVESSSDKTPLDVLVAVANLGVIAFGFFVMRYAAREQLTGNIFLVRAGAWLRAHTNAVALTYAALQYTISLFLAHEGDNFLGWIMTFPLLMLGFRMLVPELVLLHGYLVAGALVTTLLGGEGARELPIYISMIVINALALGTELFLSRRMRRETVSEWTSLRTQAREQVRMRDELRYARELQLSMLPECAPNLDWADICSISVPATEVGGDYYDYFVDQTDDRRVALVCVDVAGHGMASGLVLAALRSGFTLLRDSLHDPAAVLQRLHDPRRRDQPPAHARHRLRRAGRPHERHRHHRQRRQPSRLRPPRRRGRQRPHHRDHQPLRPTPRRPPPGPDPPAPHRHRTPATSSSSTATASTKPETRATTSTASTASPRSSSNKAAGAPKHCAKRYSRTWRHFEGRGNRMTTSRSWCAG